METLPYWLMMETLELAPTVNRYSLLVSATANVARVTKAKVASRFPCCRCSMNPLPFRSASAPGSSSLWQGPIQSHLVNHRLLTISVHQRLLRVFVVGVGLHRLLGVSDVGVDLLQVALVCVAHGGGVRRYFFEKLLVGRNVLDREPHGIPRYLRES